LSAREAWLDTIDGAAPNLRQAEALAGCRYRIRHVQGPLAPCVSSLLAVEFDPFTAVEITSFPHAAFTLTQWLGSSASGFACEDRRGMRSALGGIRLQRASMRRDGDFVMLRAFLTPLGATLLSGGQALPDMSGPKPLPIADQFGLALALSLEAQVLAAGNIDGMLDALGSWIEQRTRASRGVPQPALRAAQAAGVLNHDAAVDLQGLADIARVTRRQLERDFARWLSVSPRRYAQTVRLQRLAQLALERPALADLASEVGFADQAHMTRAVRKLTGMTPSHFLKAANNAISRAYRHAMGGRIGYLVKLLQP
jgi:AraC-like DNA-binding protein